MNSLWSRIQDSIHKFIARFGAPTLRSIQKAGRVFLAGLKGFAGPIFGRLWRKALRPLLLLTYRLSWQASNSLRKAIELQRTRVIAIAIHGIATPVLLLIVGGAAITVGFRFQVANAEDFQQDTIIGGIIVSSGSELFEDDTPIVPDVSYSPVTGLKARNTVVETEEQSIATVAGEAGAIVRPNLIESVDGPRWRDGVEKYTVQGGDTISSIAADFGVSVNTILWENQIGTRDFIKPGDVLTILPTTGVSHRIKKGDTLANIAKTYDADPAEIIAYNEMSDANDLQQDRVLIIPDGRIIPKAAPAPTRTTRNIASSIQNIITGKPADAPSAGSGMRWPTTFRKVNQYYSFRHTGVDIDGDIGNAIYAADDGRVIKVTGPQWNGGYGMHLVIDHGGGVQTLYAHASKTFVRVGDSVKKGQTIAAVGNTGRSTGPHLHFEVRIGSKRVNPLSYVK